MIAFAVVLALVLLAALGFFLLMVLYGRNP
jgi:hypothetical protein